MKGPRHHDNKTDSPSDRPDTSAAAKAGDVSPEKTVPQENSTDKKEQTDGGARKTGGADVDLQALREKASKAEEYYDRYLRAVADLENYRKRSIKDRTQAVEYAQVQIIRGLIPVVDSLQRALSQIGSQSDAKSMQEGLSLIDRQVESFLQSVGLSSFSCVGEKFDPDKHEAVLHVPSKDHPDHAILEEVQKGYTLNGRVIRHALVKVVDNPPAKDETVSEQTNSVKKETP